MLRLLCLLLFLFISFSVNSQSIFSNTIVGVNPAQFNPFITGQVIDPQLTVSGIGRGQGISANIGNNLYNAANFNSSPRDTSDYFTFTLLPEPGYQMNLVSFNYTGQRSTTGPLNFALRSSINNFSADIGTGNSLASTISLSSIAFQNITTPIEFRLYGWNAASPSGTFGITSFTFNGEVVIAPRLQASALNGFGSVCVGNVSAAQMLQLSGEGINTDSVKIGPFRGFLFSADATIYKDSISVYMPGSQTSNIWMKFAPDTIRNYSGNIVASGGGASSINIAVTGSGIGTRPSITNGTVTTVTTSSATIAFNVVMAGCSVITGIGIEYSIVPGFANGTGTMVPLGTFSQSASAYSLILTSLGPPGQVYYFHTYIINNGGVKYGLENSFSLLSDITLLNVPSGGAGSLSGFGNVCNNTVSNTLSFTLTGSMLDNSNITIGPLNGFTFSSTLTGTYSAVLNIVNGGLGYTYSGGQLTNCRVYVKFSPTAIMDYSGLITITGGGATGIQLSVSAFGVNSVPDVVTGNAIQITPYGAWVQGSIRNTGCTPLIQYGFEYSTTPAFTPGTGTMVQASNINNNNFGINLTGLQPSTVYYYYAFASNAGGIDYGILNTFYTAAIPTQLLITSFTPTFPLAFTPFTVKVTAVDNLTDRNPINVTSDTYLQLIQTSGVNVFSSAGNPAGMIPAGSSQIILNGNFYDAAEAAVSVKAVVTSGMNLQASPPYLFNVNPYSGSEVFIWSQANGNVWLNGSHWLNGTSPGSTFTNDSNRHVAIFTSQAALRAGVNEGAGIDMSQVNGDLSLGAVVFDASYEGNAVEGFIKLGNESTGNNGLLQLNGADLNNQPVLDGQGTVHVLLSNRIAGNTARNVSIVNAVNGGNKEMVLRFSEEGYLIADTGNAIHLNVLLLGNLPLHFSGGGTLVLHPAGSTTQNDFSGNYHIENGVLKIESDGAFSIVNPNTIKLGDQFGHNGILDLNNHNAKIGGLITETNSQENRVTSQIGNAVLTIQNTADCIFSGNISNGTIGQVSLIKAGAGIQTLTGANTYTGNTLITAGTLVLNHVDGNTLAAGCNISMSGGTLQISSDQIIHDLNLLGGRIVIDEGVTVTITGNYLQSGSSRIVNYGKIVMQGIARQYFPGTGTLVEYMNDLTINNPAGVTMNKSLKVRGVLHLNQGVFNWGADTLSICHPVTGNTTDILPAVNAWVEIFGIDSNTILPPSIQLLAGFLVSSNVGTTLTSNLSLSQKMIVADTAGTIVVPNNVSLNGSASLIMYGGKLMLQKNAVMLPEFTGAYQLTGGEITFNGTGMNADAQLVRAINYHHLTFSSNGGERVLSANGITGIGGDFNPGISVVQSVGSTIDFKKQGPQSIPTFRYHHLRITGGNNSVKTLSGAINVKASLTMGALTQLNLNNHDLTLLSDSVLSAQVDVVPTSNSFVYSGTGRFVVERFIPSGTNHGKTWQFLSVPVLGATLNESWQEGGSPLVNTLPGYGITVSSQLPGAVQRGFDFYAPTGGASVKTYDGSSNGWVGIDDGSLPTNQINISNSKGYMIFVRGDRSVLQYNSPATTTVLRCRGKLYAKGSDAPPAVNLNAGQFTSIGNPYAAGIDFLSLKTASSGMDPAFYVWDPLLPGAYGLGGYQTISAANGYRPVPGGTLNYDNANSYTQIASGQAFFVYSSIGGNANFNESQKLFTQQIPYRNVGMSDLRLNIQLLGQSAQLVDGALLTLSEFNTSDLSDKDIPKLLHQNADFYIKKLDQNLAIASFPYPASADTIYLGVKLNSSGIFHLKINLENISRNRLAIYLHDDLLSLDIPINKLSNDYAFITDINNFNNTANRFYLVIKKLTPIDLENYSLSNPFNCSTNNYWISAAKLDEHTLRLSNNFNFEVEGIVKLFDIQGKLIHISAIDHLNNSDTKYLKINKKLPAGIYILQLDVIKSGCLMSAVSTQLIL